MPEWLSRKGRTHMLSIIARFALAMSVIIAPAIMAYPTAPISYVNDDMRRGTAVQPNATVLAQYKPTCASCR
jgi:hypothetical protein